MKGLYTKVISGKYEQIPSHFSQDLKNVLKSCLQVRSSERSDCDQILRNPAVAKHLTTDLDQIQSRKEDTESLLQTIRCPRNLGMITDRMPAANYVSTSHKLLEKADETTPKLKATQMKAAPTDVIVTDLKSKARLSSAVNSARPSVSTTGVNEQAPRKRATSSHSVDQPLQPHLQTPVSISEKAAPENV